MEFACSLEPDSNWIIAMAHAARISWSSLLRRLSNSGSTCSRFLLPATIIASDVTSSSFFIAVIISSSDKIASSSQAILNIRFLTSELPSLNKCWIVFFHEERGRPSIISNANNCFISSSDDKVSSIVFTIAASWTSTVSSSKSICRFEIALSNCFM